MKIGCAICGRGFTSSAATLQHQRAKHPRHKDLGKVAGRSNDDDESYADIAVEAVIKRASGERLDPIEKALLP